jgi:hypothetical protein
MTGGLMNPRLYIPIVGHKATTPEMDLRFRTAREQLGTRPLGLN